ncbi:unnamed protein product [Rotaria magnacalcarata]|uniref:Uncharacterized protein n=1 Tax=Rotaria magnacalcarata TaxID=392030 RepID=A0A816YY13_9BILA|nr:unnamed protein product [Rotaria magnacalcarata]CAF1601640.1 unnamed protein product [Rotaria magnacalcarata]CAF1980423.1 unnamed protein product [Rotaria magnacalcarata]CAF2102897.1 unnamed protein product [Rotaria magnacalcarata]CAF2166310.1 unnamed protein product [Rotaria magnacalcarata]
MSNSGDFNESQDALERLKQIKEHLASNPQDLALIEEQHVLLNTMLMENEKRFNQYKTITNDQAHKTNSLEK